MVNPNSPTFKLSEKIGLIFGTTIRYLLICSAFVFLTGLVKNGKLSRSTPIKLPSNPPSSY